MALTGFKAAMKIAKNNCSKQWMKLPIKWTIYKNRLFVFQTTDFSTHNHKIKLIKNKDHHVNSFYLSFL